MVEIVTFRPEDQDATRALVLAGLVEHWGYLDESKNPDLEDIGASYADGTFLVARLDGEIVGSGALLPHTKETAQIVRMSVARRLRRRGIGRRILRELCRRAYRAGYKSMVLETTETWTGVIAFYQRFGFRVTHRSGGNVYFALDLREFFREAT